MHLVFLAEDDTFIAAAVSALAAVDLEAVFARDWIEARLALEADDAGAFVEIRAKRDLVELEASWDGPVPYVGPETPLHAEWHSRRTTPFTSLDKAQLLQSWAYEYELVLAELRRAE